MSEGARKMGHADGYRIHHKRMFYICPKIRGLKTTLEYIQPFTLSYSQTDEKGMGQ